MQLITGILMLGYLLFSGAAWLVASIGGLIDSHPITFLSVIAFGSIGIVWLHRSLEKKTEAVLADIVNSIETSDERLLIITKLIEPRFSYSSKHNPHVIEVTGESYFVAISFHNIASGNHFASKPGHSISLSAFSLVDGVKESEVTPTSVTSEAFQKVLRQIIDDVYACYGRRDRYNRERAQIARQADEKWRAVEREKEWARRQQEDLAYAESIKNIQSSDSISEYRVTNEDYKRNNDRERAYLKQHKNFLMQLFGNCCAACGEQENGLDIDHFIFAKSTGGCFAMEHKEGYVVNNAIPLCETCNRSKSDKNYKDFFSRDQLLKILPKNKEMTERLNLKRKKSA